MTFRGVHFREIIASPKARVVSADDGAWHNDSVATYTLEIPYISVPPIPRSRDFIFYDSPDPIVKSILEVTVFGLVGNKKSRTFRVDLVMLDATLTMVDALELCEEIRVRLEPLVAPRRVARINTDLLDCTISTTGRNKR